VARVEQAEEEEETEEEVEERIEECAFLDTPMARVEDVEEEEEEVREEALNAQNRQRDCSIAGCFGQVEFL
jgi:hypothetical protein